MASDSTDGLTIEEFCRTERIAPSTFHLWRKSGVAPDCFQLVPRGRVRILPQAVAEWRARFSRQPATAQPSEQR
jgi:hypothetical protein